MLTHPELRGRLPALLDDELPPSELAEVRAHLETCEACRRELSALQLTLAALGGLPRPAAPPDLAPAIRRRIRRRGQATVPGGGGWHQGLAAAAVVAMVVGTGVLATDRLAQPTHLEAWDTPPEAASPAPARAADDAGDVQASWDPRAGELRLSVADPVRRQALLASASRAPTADAPPPGKATRSARPEAGEAEPRLELTREAARAVLPAEVLARVPPEAWEGDRLRVRLLTP